MKPGNRQLCTVLILADLRRLFRVWEMREFMDISINPSHFDERVFYVTIPRCSTCCSCTDHICARVRAGQKE